MELRPSGECGEFVSQSDSHALLAAVAAGTTNPIAGIYGPESLSWRINRESALFLGAGRAALLQLAHPWVASALAEHSRVLDRPIARFHGTFRIVFTMVFGSLDQALAAARHLYALHTRIRGQLPEDAARWQRGSSYEANEIGALRWVYATLVESAVLAYECALGPLAAAEREQYYAETKTLAALFGLPAAALPQDWEAFAAYNRAIHAADNDALGVSSAARAMAHNLLRGAGIWLWVPFWYRALTVGWLPVRFRREFGLDFGEAEQQAAARARANLPWIYVSLPHAVRFSGPWREAQARLAGRRAGLLAQWSNRFWIGQPLLAFDDPRSRAK
ncbi:MAG: oxygenase MpaB family protein [Terracidiphilus sp.]